MNFREMCYSMRGLIWLAAISMLLAVLLWAPVEALGGDVSGSTIFLGIVSVPLFIWAFWASFPPHKSSKK